MLSRLKFEIAPLVDEILDQIPEDQWISTTSTFFDPAIGGGQFVSAIETKLRKYGHSDENISGRVFGCESDLLSVQYAINKYGLIGTYYICNFLEEEWGMKFDNILGNPPYQSPKNVENSNKLYIAIAQKSIKLLKENGNLYFITPQAVLIPSRLNKLPELFNNHLVEVNYTANDYFNIGQSVISWHYTTKPIDKIRITDQSIRYVDSVYNISNDNNRMLIKILNKVDFHRNGQNKLKIIQTGDKQHIPKKKLYLNKKENSVEVICSSSKNPIQYCNIEDAYSPSPQLIIPFIGGWNKGCEINDKPTNKDLFTNRDRLNQKELKVLKSYLESNLISFCVNEFKKIKPGMGYTFLRKLSEIDLTRTWTDAELYKHFNLTQEEIDYVEANVK